MGLEFRRGLFRSSPLDKAVMGRATSLYLHEGTTHMRPEQFGIGLYSLLAGEKRPTMIAEFRLDSEGKLMSVTPRMAWTTTKANVTYEVADAAIKDGTDESLVIAHSLAEKLVQGRIESGACIIRKPEPEVTVEGEGTQTKVDITLKEIGRAHV